MKPFEENMLFDVTEAKTWVNVSSVFHFNSLFQKYLLCIKKIFLPFQIFWTTWINSEQLTYIHKNTFSAQLSCSYVIFTMFYMNFLTHGKKLSSYYLAAGF